MILTDLSVWKTFKISYVISNLKEVTEIFISQSIMYLVFILFCMLQDISIGTELIGIFFFTQQTALCGPKSSQESFLSLPCHGNPVSNLSKILLYTVNPSQPGPASDLDTYWYNKINFSDGALVEISKHDLRKSSAAFSYLKKLQYFLFFWVTKDKCRHTFF